MAETVAVERMWRQTDVLVDLDPTADVERMKSLYNLWQQTHAPNWFSEESFLKKTSREGDLRSKLSAQEKDFDLLIYQQERHLPNGPHEVCGCLSDSCIFFEEICAKLMLWFCQAK